MRGQVSLFLVVGILLLLVATVSIVLWVAPDVLKFGSTDPVELFVTDCYREVSGCYLYYDGLQRQNLSYIYGMMNSCYDGFQKVSFNAEAGKVDNVSIYRKKDESQFSAEQNIIVKDYAGERTLNEFYTSHPVRLSYLEEFDVGEEIDLNKLREFDGRVELYEWR